MLKFILGRACSGKTFKTIDYASADSQIGRVIIIIPEQFSFETERAILKKENAVAENIGVFSFSRLFDEVAEGSGLGRISCVTDFEKNILTKKALELSADNLKVFSKFVSYNDFPQKIQEAIQDLKFAGVDSKMMSSVALEIGGTCGAKLQDIATISSVYEALISERFIDPADRLSKLYDILCDYEYFKGKSVYFDSFSGFTGQQYKVIEKIIEQADNVTIAFCTSDKDNLDIGLFYNVNSAIAKIKSMAAHRGISQPQYEIIDKSFYSNSAMVAFEGHLSNTNKTEKPSGIDLINVIECETPREEAAAAAKVISSLIADYGYRYRDFLLVARNADNYANYVSKQCELNNIPCFMDKSVPLTETPLCIYIKTLVELAVSLSSENILKLIKLDLNGIEREDISELEDYLYMWDISASDWKDEWTMSVKGLTTDEDGERDILRLKAINATREKINHIVDNFKRNFKGNARVRSIAIFRHLVENKIDESLVGICRYFDEQGDFAYSNLLKQSWDTMLSVLDSVVRVLGDDELNHERFADALDVAASAAKISNTPQMLDEITFGSADRIRPSKPKISIILGANQGVFPQISSKNSVFSSGDKDKLLQHGISLDDGIIKGAVEENYLVYSMLCCPVDRVYVLYSRRSEKCEELEPSTFVSEILSYFGDLKKKEYSPTSFGEFAPRTAAAAFYDIGELTPKDFEEVRLSLSDYTKYSDKLNVLLHTDEPKDFSVSPETSKALFGSEIRMSATRFDTYHKCSLSYFLKNGLGAKTLKKADLNVLQRGTIAHYVLETIVKRHKKALSGMSAARISAEVDSIIDEYFRMINGSQLLMTARFSYLLGRISASIKQIVMHIAEEFGQTEFEPTYCELSIGTKGDIPQLVVELDNNASVVLEGKIDRVDVFKNNVRVVDYKTGKMTFELSDTLVGLNMQMMLYLYAFIKNGGTLVQDPQPAGILYMPARTSSTVKSLRMNGLISNDEEIRSAMEKDNGGVFVPKYSEKSQDYVDKQVFEQLFDKIEDMIKEMGENIQQGKFAADPTDGVSINACTYCDFKSICRSADNPHKKTVKYTSDEIKELLSKGGEDNGV